MGCDYPSPLLPRLGKCLGVARKRRGRDYKQEGAAAEDDAGLQKTKENKVERDLALIPRKQGRLPALWEMRRERMQSIFQTWSSCFGGKCSVLTKPWIGQRAETLGRDACPLVEMSAVLGLALKTEVGRKKVGVAGNMDCPICFSGKAESVGS